MTLEIQLQVEGDVFNSDETSMAIMSDIPDVMWTRTNGIRLMTVLSDGDPVADAVKAVRCARNRGIQVLRMFRDPVNVGEIARRIGGNSREAVRKWTALPNFPTPFGSGGGERSSHVWLWADVVTWIYDVKGIDMDEQLPDAKTVAAIDAHIHGLTDFDSVDMHTMSTKFPDAVVLFKVHHSHGWDFPVEPPSMTHLGTVNVG